MPSRKPTPTLSPSPSPSSSSSPPSSPKDDVKVTPATSDKIDEMFRRWKSANPEPKSDLVYTNPYTLLVAVVLSAQATDVGVNRATKDLFARISTPSQMVELGEDSLREEIRTIGLYRNKARNVIALSQRLIDDHDSCVPDNREALEALPGVGRKTANVVLNVAFAQPTMAVDTHVFRISRRIGLSEGNTPLAVELDLNRVIPESYAMLAHHWLILHGRYVCTAKRPKCENCIVRDLCPSAQ